MNRLFNSVFRFASLTFRRCRKRGIVYALLQPFDLLRKSEIFFLHLTNRFLRIQFHLLSFVYWLIHGEHYQPYLDYLSERSDSHF